MGFRTEVEPEALSSDASLAERAMRENAMQTERLRAGLPRHRDLIRSIHEQGLQRGMSASITNLELLNARKAIGICACGPRPARDRISFRSSPASSAWRPHRAQSCSRKKPATGTFFAGAMFAFKPGESFLHEEGDRGNGFTPLSLQRDGFFIAGSRSPSIGTARASARPKASRCSMARTSRASACAASSATLGQLKAGLDATDRFIRTLAELKLIEPIDIQLNFETGGERLTLQGLYTVSLDGLRTLSDSAAGRLLRAGYLQHAYTMSASLEQLPVLARLRDQAIRRTLSAS